MYSLKQIPEDFQVTELSSCTLQPQGQYLYYTLWKKNYNTLLAIQKIAQLLHIKEKQIGFAGSKDKKALTTQAISFQDISKEKVAQLHLSDLKLSFLGFSDKPLSLGELQGNQFRIVVRNITTKPRPITHFPNYFDEQRFGSNNAVIGKHLLKKEFKAALDLIASPECERHLCHHPTDHVGALRQLPIRLLRLYLNSYQSLLWNQTLAMHLKNNSTIIQEIPYSQGTFIFPKEIFSQRQIPILGFSSEDAPECREIIAEIMKKEDIEYDDFIIKQIPQLTLEGELRSAFVEIKDLRIDELQPDELNAGQQKITICFTLPKGSYATMLIKAMF